MKLYLFDDKSQEIFGEMAISENDLSGIKKTIALLNKECILNKTKQLVIAKSYRTLVSKDNDEVYIDFVDKKDW